MSSYRPRRTRIYGANYDIGESYYKKQLENLDSKRGLNRFSENSAVEYAPKEDKFNSKLTFSKEDDDIYRVTPLGEKIRPKFSMDNAFEDNDDMFNVSFKKTSKSKSVLDDFDNNFSMANKRAIVSNHDAQEGLGEYGFGKSLSLKNNEKVSLNFGDDDNESRSVITSRRLKITSEGSWLDDKTKIDEASSRAKATKARLANLEEEMFNITEKQNERAKRSMNLKKLLNESEFDTSSKMVKEISI